MAIFELDSKERYEELVKENSTKFLGKGAEGDCYLLPDNMVYKVIKKHVKENLTPESIITSEQVNSTHFIFPNQVYTCEGEIIGTQTNFISLVDKESLFEELEPKFINAVLDFAHELEQLSKKGFIAIDFSDNFIFDGDTLFNIDTTNHAFDTTGKYSKNYLMVWNFSGLIKGLRETLGDSLTLNIDEVLLSLEDKYVNNYLMNMAEERSTTVKR